MDSNDGGFSIGQVRHIDIRNQSHPAAVTHFALDSLLEQFLGRPSLRLLEVCNLPYFRTIPVVADRQPENAGAMDWIAAEDCASVEPAVPLAIDLQVCLQPRVLRGIEQMNAFGVE